MGVVQYLFHSCGAYDVTPTKRWQTKMLREGRCRQCGRKREKYAHHCDDCQAKARRRLQRWRDANGTFSKRRLAKAVGT